ncbi:3-hydroxyisobutyryl-CoA hydrolase 1 [Quillaja saponaria]|uniref:3-hydroxyisobutyryl-CoA hydrolase n=1 Tax=Quillaja saponaria TaxID=32244 RepID=A0AAD7Q5Z5_QUISA|nr:3-hydroxyisobutyryl-CoA hydrolase 1 [Quillaja saponaria]
MALSFSFDKELKQVLFKGNSCVREVILNRPKKLNSLNHEMIIQMMRNLKQYENDPSVKLVIMKGNGKAFCAGGDVVSAVISSIAGHWSYPASFYRKQLILDHLIATYRKPLVALINGIVMGGVAGISMNARFRVVTEKAVFAMPEASIGLIPDVGASHFLSKLPGYFGEYLGLTGAKLDGAEIFACGLATHFVPSKNLNLLENSLRGVTSSDIATITTLINKFGEDYKNIKEDSPFKRLDTINKCFSGKTVEEIISSLENKNEKEEEKWISRALNSMRSSCPTSLKIFLRSGSRAKLFDKDNNPKWEPSKLELVSKEMVDQYFLNIEDDDWEPLEFPARSNLISKL